MSTDIRSQLRSVHCRCTHFVPKITQIKGVTPSWKLARPGNLLRCMWDSEDIISSVLRQLLRELVRAFICMIHLSHKSYHYYEGLLTMVGVHNMKTHIQIGTNFAMQSCGPAEVTLPRTYSESHTSSGQYQSMAWHCKLA